MKSKTAEKILRGSFARFLKSIEDKNVQTLVKNNSIITGGAIVSLVLNEKVNDFDVYFTNKETVLAVCNYYKKILIKEGLEFEGITIEETENRIKFRIPSAGIRKPESEGKKYYPAVLTDNAISLTNDFQLIIRFYGPANEIHRNYDFVHVKSYWTSCDGKLHLNPDSVEAILSRELRYEGSLYPLASIFRLRKFLSRGWTISAGDIFKMAFQVSKLDFSNPQVIYDQLIGVDVHYFNQMISRIQEDLRDGKIKSVDEGYLSQLVDEIFHQSDDYDVEAYLKQSDNDKSPENE